jgi:hypothetical protein
MVSIAIAEPVAGTNWGWVADVLATSGTDWTPAVGRSSQSKDKSDNATNTARRQRRTAGRGAAKADTGIIPPK